MNKLTKNIISFLFLFSLLQAKGDENKELKIYTCAVFNFAEGSEDLAGQGAAIGELMNAFLSTSESAILVERTEINKVLAEQKLSLTGNVGPQETIRAGKLTGAQILITGRVFKAGAKNYAVAKVIGSESGRVYAATVTFSKDDDLGDSVQKLADKVTKILEGKAAEMVPEAQSYEELIADLKMGLPGKLPAVYVKIPEQHLSRAVPDPACQTEILKVIKDCGFEITDEPAKAEIKITGEAFSQLAVRREELVACRARAEIKIQSGDDEELESVDRVTVGAVDLAEDIAGKSALQKAGRQLAIRFVASRKKK